MTTTLTSSFDENQPSSSAISFIQSQKGKPLLVSNKYIFKLNKTTTTTTKYWIYTHIECPAKIPTSLKNQLIKMSGEHCHPAEEKIDVRELCETVKQ